MSKGKYKRKKQHAQNRANSDTSQTALTNEERHQHIEANKDQAATHAKREEENRRMLSRIWVWIRRQSFTDWVIAIFTVVLGIVGIIQSCILRNQLDGMRKDQRPWIRMTATLPGIPIANVPITANFSFVNFGKTPAKRIAGDFILEKVRNGEDPTFLYPFPHDTLTTGVVYPNQPTENFPVQLRDQRPVNSSEAPKLTEEEVKDYMKGGLFFVMFGTITYTDFFKIEHWATMCRYDAATIPGVTYSISVKKCTDYNDTDNN